MSERIGGTPAAKKSTGRRPAAPPNRVEPGWIHEALADATLGLLKRQVKLDVGNLESPLTGGVGTDDGPEPRDLLARVYAHVGHRVPGVKRLEKRLEGSDKRAGIAADVGALCAQLYRRNSELFDEVAPQLVARFFNGLNKSATDAPGATVPGRNSYVFDPSIPEAPTTPGGTP